MDANTIRERMESLRLEMKENQMQWYLIPTGDFHNSEYVNDYFKVREFFSGFTGSNGTLLVSETMAGLWTDGRYFIQAEKELHGTDITLFRMMEEGVPTILEYLEAHMKQGDTIGFHGNVMTASYGEKLEHLAEKVEGKILYEKDLAAKIWMDRPVLPCHGAYLLDQSITGEATDSKIKRLREAITEAGAQCHVLTKLDDIMWLFNMRGSDIQCNPVALAYGIITLDQAYLFLQKDVLEHTQRNALEEKQITIEDYRTFYDVLKSRICDRNVLIDKKNVNYSVWKILQNHNEVLDQTNPTEAMKAVKNAVEIDNLKKIYVEDSVAVTKFIYWIKNIVKEKTITEYDAAEYLDELRRNIPGFLDLSFDTISAYMENAAMMHYTASSDNAKELHPEGTLLVDSGGQYMGGTTDVTRTITLGEISEQESLHYTYTCVGMLNLLNARFLYGCTGRNLDILAREPLWRINVDYKCGTGHGIGYILNVHEGPQNIRWRYTQDSPEAVFEEGMVVSNEPGVYIEGAYGIRIENIMLCRKGKKNGDGQFMYFEPLTFVPIDRKALDRDCMSQRDKDQLNMYHLQVYEKICPYLDEKERRWLWDETSPV